MAKRGENPLEIAVKGGIAGLVGTVALTAAAKGLPILLERFGLDVTPPNPPTSGSKGLSDLEKEPYSLLAGKVAEGLLNTDLSKGEQIVAGQAMHWGYGAAWGAVYGLGQSILRLPHLLHGTLLGGLVFSIASTLVPAMGISPPHKAQEPATRAIQVVTCLLFGWVTALTFHTLSRSSRRN